MRQIVLAVLFAAFAGVFGGGVAGCYQMSEPAKPGGWHPDETAKEEYRREKARYDEGADRRLPWQVLSAAAIFAGAFGWLIVLDLLSERARERP